jgi:chaperonin cofactor prefoldin
MGNLVESQLKMRIRELEDSNEDLELRIAQLEELLEEYQSRAWYEEE